jgi:hypothetical protein
MNPAMNNPLMLVIYAAAIFSVVTLAGLAALRLKNVALRALAFLALCYVLFKGTLWLSKQWSIDPVEVGYAWGLALALVVIIEATIRIRRRKRVSAAP